MRELVRRPASRIYDLLVGCFGLFGVILLLLVAVVGTAVVGDPITLVYVLLVRMFLDLGFGAALNLGIISRRHRVQ